MSDFPAFVEASRKGQLVSLADQKTRFSLGADWAIPQFEFGRFWNADDTPLWDGFIEEMKEILRAGDLKLPFSRCVYSFEPPHNKGPQFVALEQTDEGVNLTIFTEVNGKWYCSPEPIELWDNPDGEYKVGAHVPDFIEDDEILQQASYHMFALAIMGTIMLDSDLGGVTREAAPSPRLPFVNAGRARAGHPPLPQTIRLRIDEGRFRQSYRDRRATGAGSQKQPHYRRGHRRRLPSGKLIWVNDCSIHGGAAPERVYIVGSSRVGGMSEDFDYSYVHLADGTLAEAGKRASSGSRM